MNNIPVITIDGPSGSGKGAISKLLAEKLGWHFLDSGAIYRVLALVIIRRKIPLDDISALVAVGKNLNVKFINQPKLPQKIMVADEEVTTIIREEECGVVASKIAALREVREVLIAYQHSFRKFPGLIADGRDMGTVVFPDAKLKIFLTADVKERARRRLLQLQDQSINATLGKVLQDLTVRDQRDHDRVASPLKPAAAAVIVDATKLSINEVLQQILVHVKNVNI